MAILNRALGQRTTSSRTKFARQQAGLLFVLPSVLFMVIFFVVPALMALWISLHNWPLFGPTKFNGITNYLNLFKDPQFWRSIGFTSLYAVLVTPPIFVLGLIMALLVNQGFRAVGFFRVAFFLPNVISFGAVCLMWFFMLNDQIGIINTLLRQLNVIQGSFLWLANYNTAMLAILILVVWKAAGGTMLLLLIGLQAIPEDLYQAASVDGANSWSRFRYITLPLLKRSFALALVLSVTGSYLAFDQFYILTQGGPQNRTVTMVYWIVNNAFISFKVGYATAISMILLVILVLLNAAQLFLLRESE